MDARLLNKTSIVVAAITIVSIANVTWAADIVWTRTFGGSGCEQGYAIAETADGGHVIAGWTDSCNAGNIDMLLKKVDSGGTLQWSRVFGGGEADFCGSVQQTRDGGYILGGWTYSFGAGSYDMYLVKTDSRGILEWQRTFGGSCGDYCYSVQETTDGGFILCGCTREEFTASTLVYLVKTDSQGQLEWEKQYGGTENDGGYSVQQTRDGGYILAGDSRSFSQKAQDYDMYLIKTDHKGRLQWQRTFGGEQCDGSYSVQQTSDGGYVLAGDCESYGSGLFDVYLVKTDSKGRLEWQKTFGGSGWDDCYDVREAEDGGFVLAGCSDSFGAGDFDMYLIRTDHRGNLVWQETFGNGQNEYAYALGRSRTGAYILAGYTENNTLEGDAMKLTYILDKSEVGKMSDVILMNYIGADNTK